MSIAGHDEALVGTSTVKPANDRLAIHQPHDKFAKCAFEDKEIAIDFFAAHLADRNLTQQELEHFDMGHSEYTQPEKPRRYSDVVYQGRVGNQKYYIALEHQSSLDREIVPRLLEYSAALMRKQVAQEPLGQAVVVPICLYHEPHHHSDPVNKQTGNHKPMIERLCGSQQDVERFNQFHSIKVVDLTVMTHEEIGSHGKAAIVEWVLKDAQLPGDQFLLQVTKHLSLAGYDSTNTGSASFRSAILEYILSVYQGDKTLEEVIDELCQVMPQEREVMGKLANTLLEQGRLEGRQGIAKEMLMKHIDPLLVQECTHFSAEELAELSPDRSESTPPKQEVPQSLNSVVQSLVSTPWSHGKRRNGYSNPI